MMRIALALVFLAAPALAQEQQAGNEASTNADATFQALVEQCDDTDVLTLRARVRLLLGRTTDTAASEAQALLEQGLEKCAAGDVEGARADLGQAVEVADAGTDEVFGPDGDAGEAGATAEVEPVEVEPAEETVAQEESEAAPTEADAPENPDAPEPTEAAADPSEPAEEEDDPWWKFW